MSQLVGSLAVLTMALILSLRAAGVLRERLAQLEGFILLLRHIREQIAVFRTPTREILSGFQNEALRRAGFLAAAEERGFAAALYAVRDRLYLDECEEAALSEFAHGLGGGYTEEELARCDLCLGRLTAAAEERRAALPRLARLYRTLMVGGALAVIILLL